MAFRRRVKQDRVRSVAVCNIDFTLVIITAVFKVITSIGPCCCIFIVANVIIEPEFVSERVKIVHCRMRNIIIGGLLNSCARGGACSANKPSSSNSILTHQLCVEAGTVTHRGAR